MNTATATAVDARTATTAALARLQRTFNETITTEREAEHEQRIAAVRRIQAAARPRSTATDFRTAARQAYAGLRQQNAADATIHTSIADLALRFVSEKYQRPTTNAWRDCLAVAIGKCGLRAMVDTVVEFLSEPVDPRIRNFTAIIVKRAEARVGK